MSQRSAIEPMIGHLKQDHRLERNYLNGSEGDRWQAVLWVAGYNVRKLLSALLRALRRGWFSSFGLRLRCLFTLAEFTLTGSTPLQP